jgi:hypothetical protein
VRVLKAHEEKFQTTTEGCAPANIARLSIGDAMAYYGVAGMTLLVGRVGPYG